MTSEPYAWDEWERYALAEGIDPGLASLCRSTIRDAYRHHWKGHAYYLCIGSNNLTELARRAPELCARLCGLLRETDGLGSAVDETTGETFELRNCLTELEGEAYL
mgnify:FL=1|tara:strand:+ start:517 stop:834 length:318 start_codon:yes stop_codon:yes gene_type:complete